MFKGLPGKKVYLLRPIEEYFLLDISLLHLD